MTISSDLGRAQLDSIIESTTTAGQPGIVVLNPDGSNISGGGGGGGDASAANQTTEIARLTSILATQTDGTQKVKLTDGTDDANVTLAGELQVLASAQPGTDIGDVTINNAAGASAVNIQDGGNSITVDGSVTANIGTIGDLATQTTLSALNTKVITCDTSSISGSVTANIGTIADLATQTTLSALNTKVIACDTSSIGGSVTANIGTIADLATATKQSDGTQKTMLVDEVGNVIGSTSNALDVNIASGVVLSADISQTDDSIVVYGNDGTTNRVLKTDASGELQIDVLSSSLPTGAATEATLSTLNGKVTACDTGAVTVAASALPSGASTSALQTTGNTSLSSIDGKITACNTGAVTIVNAAGASAVNIQDGGNTITVDGTVSVTGVSTATNQTDGSQKTQLVDSVGAVIGATGNALDVNIASGLLTVDLTEADDSVAVYGNDGTTNRVLKTDAAGELQVDVLSSALPTGAATEATLSTLNGKVTACNTGSVTIVNAAGGSAVNIQDGGNSITIDGSVSITPLTSTHTGTTTTVGDSTSSTTLLAANTARSGAAIRNGSTARLYLEQGSTATTSSVDYLDLGEIYELPILAGNEVYRGIITGIWESDAGGSAYIRENV